MSSPAPPSDPDPPPEVHRSQHVMRLGVAVTVPAVCSLVIIVGALCVMQVVWQAQHRGPLATLRETLEDRGALLQAASAASEDITKHVLVDVLRTVERFVGDVHAHRSHLCAFFAWNPVYNRSHQANPASFHHARLLLAASSNTPLTYASVTAKDGAFFEVHNPRRARFSHNASSYYAAELDSAGGMAWRKGCGSGAPCLSGGGGGLVLPIGSVAVQEGVLEAGLRVSCRVLNGWVTVGVRAEEVSRAFFGALPAGVWAYVTENGVLVAASHGRYESIVKKIYRFLYFLKNANQPNSTTQAQPGGPQQEDSERLLHAVDSTDPIIAQLGARSLDAPARPLTVTLNPNTFLVLYVFFFLSGLHPTHHSTATIHADHPHPWKLCIAVDQTYAQREADTSTALTRSLRDRALSDLDDVDTGGAVYVVVPGVFVCILMGAQMVFVYIVIRKVTYLMHMLALEIHALALFDLDSADEHYIADSSLLGVDIDEAVGVRKAVDHLAVNMGGYKQFLPTPISNPLATQRKESTTPPPGLNSGEAAIVFTDIVGSTMMWESSYEGMHRGLIMHNEVIRYCISSHGGYEVKTIGDSFMVAFDSLVSGVCFAVMVQESLAACDWDDTLNLGQSDGIMVRIGATVGSVSVQTNTVTQRSDYFGPTVNMAARLEGICTKGAVAVLEDALQALRVNDVRVIHLGRKKVKGIQENVFVVLLVPLNIPLREERIEAELGLKGLELEGGSLLTLTAELELMENSARSSHRSSIGSSSIVSTKPLVRRTRALSTTSSCGVPMALVPQSSQSISLRLDTAASATLALVECVFMDNKNSESICLFLNRALCRVFSIVDLSLGRVISVCGAGAIVGWNISNPAPNHVEAGLRLVSQLRRNNTDEAMRCGVATGRVMSGYIGDSHKRFHTAVGGCMRAAIRCCARCEVLGCTAIFASEERPTISKLLAKRFLRPVDEFYMNGMKTLGYEIQGNLVREWLSDKSRVLFTDDPKEVEVVEDTLEDATPEGACWSQDYVDAFADRDFEVLDEMGEVDPIVAEVAKYLRADMVANKARNMFTRTKSALS